MTRLFVAIPVPTGPLDSLLHKFEADIIRVLRSVSQCVPKVSLQQAALLAPYQRAQMVEDCCLCLQVPNCPVHNSSSIVTNSTRTCAGVLIECLDDVALPIIRDTLLNKPPEFMLSSPGWTAQSEMACKVCTIACLAAWAFLFDHATDNVSGAAVHFLSVAVRGLMPAVGNRSGSGLQGAMPEMGGGLPREDRRVLFLREVGTHQQVP